MSTSVVVASPYAGSIPPGFVSSASTEASSSSFISINVSSTPFSISSLFPSWSPPSGMPRDILQTLTDPRTIKEVIDPINHREYMRLIIFKKGDSPFPTEECTNLTIKKLEIEKQQEILNGSSRFNSPRCLKVRYVAAIILGIAFVILFSLPESVFLEDTKASLPSALLAIGKGISLCGSVTGLVKSQRKAIQKAEASQRLDTVTAEINQIVKEKRAWFEARAAQCLIDHVERTPCYDDSKMLGKLMARGILLEKDRTMANAKNLLMKMILDTYWKTSQEFIRVKLRDMIPNERMIDRILRPLMDAVSLIQQENSMDTVRRGLSGLREDVNHLAGNTMIHYLRMFRATQKEMFENRLNPPATDLYGAYLRPIQREAKPKTDERGERKEDVSNKTRIGTLPRKTSIVSPAKRALPTQA